MKYNIYHDGETQGPFTRVELKTKSLPPDTPCAAEGETAWSTVGAVMDQPEPQPAQLEHTAVGALVGGVMLALWMVSLLTAAVSAKVLLMIGSVGVLALGVLAILRIRKSETGTGISLLAVGMVLAVMVLAGSMLVTLDDGKKRSSGSYSNDNAKKEGRADGTSGIGKARAMVSQTACFANQRTIRTTIQNWAIDKRKDDSSAPTEDDLRGYFEGERMPKCRAGGEYHLATVGGFPSCSIHGSYIDEYDDENPTAEDTTTNEAALVDASPEDSTSITEPIDMCPHCRKEFPVSNIHFHILRCPLNTTDQRFAPANGKAIDIDEAGEAVP